MSWRTFARLSTRLLLPLLVVAMLAAPSPSTSASSARVSTLNSSRPLLLIASAPCSEPSYTTPNTADPSCLQQMAKDVDSLRLEVLAGMALGLLILSALFVVELVKGG